MSAMLACGGASDDGREPSGASGVPTAASVTATGGGPTGEAATSEGTVGSTSIPDTSGADTTADDNPIFDVGSLTSGPGEECVPPDVLVVLDRSQSMHRNPAGDTPNDNMAGYMSSRWWIALEALDALWLEFDAGLALGLSMFPAAADGCVTLAQRIGGMGAGNDGCGTSEPVFDPMLGTTAQLNAALDPLGTLLCNQTPIAAAIDDAVLTLQGLAAPDHEQFVILLTDGGESCDGDFTRSVQDLVANTGARVYVVAFGQTALTNAHGGLNRMACAGQTALGFPAPCSDDGLGNFDAADPGGAVLYIPAEDGMALADAFTALGDALCCGDACPEG